MEPRARGIVAGRGRRFEASGRDRSRLATIDRIARGLLAPISSDEALAVFLHAIAELPWLDVPAAGALFLVGTDDGGLELEASYRVSVDDPVGCDRVELGTCACGRAVAEQRAIAIGVGGGCALQSSWLGDRLCIPIHKDGRPLGALELLIASEYRLHRDDLDFLTTAATMLTAVATRNRAIRRADGRRASEHAGNLDATAAGVAHTVRNPLHGVLNCVDLLEAHLGDLDPDTRETLELMREGLGCIDNLTKRLLGATRDGGARRPEATSVDDLLGAVERRMSSVARCREVTLRVDQMVEEIEAVIDAERVVEAICNVVDNAIAACRPNGSVILRARRVAGGGLVVEVQDDGSGISAEHLERVLDPFFTTKPPAEGYGLGLAITRGVMDEHGGRVDLESWPGAGTRVQLALPGSRVFARS